MKKKLERKAAVISLALMICFTTACGSAESKQLSEKSEAVNAETIETGKTESKDTENASTEKESSEKNISEKEGSEKEGPEEEGSEKEGSEKETSEKDSSEKEASGKEAVSPKEPQVALSGKAEDILEIKECSYYEGDRYVLFFGKGVKIHGDIAKKIEQVMKEEEDLFGLRYEKTKYLSDCPNPPWRSQELGCSFDGINPDREKVDILVAHYENDGAIEWSDVNTILLFDEDFEEETNGIKTIYHEMGHVLRLRQSPNLGNIIEEGIGLYAEDMLCRKNNVANWDLIQYYDVDGYMVNYDTTEMKKNPEKVFREVNGAPRSAEQPEYAYGIRFVHFLFETYGTDVVKKLSDVAVKYEFSYDDAAAIIRVLKEATGDDVFTRYARWLPDGWKNWCKAYKEYMKPYGFQ